jgi:hypothetical protein
MAKKKSIAPASLKPAAGTKPTTTKKVIPPDVDVDGPILSRSLGPKWEEYAGSINTSLAEVAALEKTNDDTGDDVCSIFNELTYSPMYRLLMGDLKASLSKHSHDEPDWSATLFAARMYWAGLRSGRREALQAGGAK